jgi:hypothetical protein
LTVRDGGQTVTARAKVGPGREDLLEFVDVTPAPAGLRGKTGDVAFFHRDGAFRFRTQLVAVDKARASCLATHTLELHETEGSRLRRVRVERPIRFGRASEPAGKYREGTLENASTGGACLVADAGFQVGEKLVLDIRPSQYQPRRRAARREGLEDRRLNGTIVGRTEARGGRCYYHIEFSDLPQGADQYLVRLVSLLEVIARDRWARE